MIVLLAISMHGWGETNIMTDKKAKWIHIIGVATPGGDPYYECSNCGYGRCYGVEYPEPLENRCPYCNAEMENGKE